MQANAAGESGSSRRGGGGGGVLQENGTNARLLQHANDVRKHANLDTLDAFLQQSGYSWIEMMISHAKDSFESYQTSAHDADSTMAHAFEYHMAAEMLKTPSPKKKRAPAFNRAALDNRGRVPAAPAVSSEALADDKENTQLPLPSSNAAITPLSPTVEGKKAGSRNMRSRGDKSQLIQLPNPFQTRPQQPSTSQAKEAPTKVAKQAQTKAKALSDKAKAPEVQAEVVLQSTASPSRPEPSATIAKTVVTASSPRERVRKAKPPVDDDSQEVEYSLQLATGAQVTLQQTTTKLASASVLEIDEESASAKPSAEVEMLEEESTHDSGGQCTTVEAEDDDDDDDDDDVDDDDEEAESLTRSVRVASSLNSPSPRESTPPPQSPTKAQRAEMSRFAREKLDESLLKLASDDEESAEDEDSDESALQSWARREKHPSSQRSEQNTPKIEQAENGKETAAVPVLSSDDAFIDGEEIDKAKPQPAAPKRTLSSMTHAKKSLVGSSSIISKQQASLQRTREPSIVSGPTNNAPQTKSSFLSKSIMRVEQDQRSLGDAMDATSDPTNAAHVRESFTSKKRKSDEREDEEEVVNEERTAKAAKETAMDVNGPSNASNAVESKKLAKPAREEEATCTAPHPQPQSLREKIESYNVHKNIAPTNAVPRNFSSMSTHAVGLGPSKISSPILGQSESQKSLHSDVSPPCDAAKNVKQAQATSPVISKSVPTKETDESRAAPAAAKATKIPAARPIHEQSTTPLNSPTKPAPTTLAKAVQAKAAAAAAPSSSSSPIRNAKNGSRDSIDEASESDAGVYDTSSDGDLSLVDLMGGANINTTVKHTATAPRPPGTGLRPKSALPKHQAATATPATTGTTLKGSTFMPSSTAQKDGSRPASRLGRAGADQKGSTASTASVSSASSAATSGSVASSTYHATWGGSISSKLKGILGFSSSTSGASPTAPTSPSKSKNAAPSSIGSSGKVTGGAPVSIPVRKESFISGSATGGGSSSNKHTSASLDKKPASVIRADAARKREVEQADRRAKEKEDRAKAAQEASKKRLRDEQVAAASSLSAPSATTKAKVSSVGPSTGKTLAHQASQQKIHAAAAAAASDPKKRKSNDGVAVAAVALVAKPTSKAPAASSHATSKPSSSKPTSTAQASAKKPQAKPQPMASQANIFSDHNPFQRAQQQQQQQSLAAVSQQVHKHKPSVAPMAKLSPASKAQAVANTAHIELEEPDSAYSDSDDEETIKRRQQHKPWETREGLALALEAQASIDADMIFGIPQGAVPLDDILPAETEHARVRRMRPRSSSATWSRDGLKQFEIDRYNERMGIASSGVQLLGTATRDDGSGTPSRGGAGRMSALAQSAIAQGASSSKKSSSHAHR